MPYTEEDLKSALGGKDFPATPTESSLVNETTPKSGYGEGDLGASLHSDFLYSQSGAAIEQNVEQKQRMAALPKTWFGELWQGGRVGIDQLQQLLYAGGAISADAAGLDGLKESFLNASRAQDKEIAGEPLSVEDTSDINSFDTFMRWFAGSAGKAAPQLAESIVTGAAAAAYGSSIGPEGTVYGGLSGFVERQAIANIIKSQAEGLVGKELKDYATGALTKEVLSEAAKTALVNETKGLITKYGTEAAIGLNSWATETASIYDSVKDQPDVPDSQKKTAAILGGLVAAIPDTAFKGYIASKFFPGVTQVASSEVDAAEKYLLRFAKAGAKELPKVIASGFGEEYSQTMVEEAAKAYADPNTREKVFDFTSEQWHSFLEAGYQGAVAEGTFGGVLATHGEAMRPHPNAKVREMQARVTALAADLQPPVVNEGAEEQRLSAIAKRRDTINGILAKPELSEPDRQAGIAELQTLQAEEDKLLGMDTLVNENAVAQPKPATQTDVTAPETTETEESETPKSVILPPVRTLTPLEQSVTHLRAFYAQEMPSQASSTTAIPIDTKAVAAQREKVTSLVNEIAKDAATPEEAQAYGGAIHQALDDNALNFLHHEGIDIRQANPKDLKALGGKEGFAVISDGGERIVMLLPTIGTVRQVGAALSPDEAGVEKSVKGYLDSVAGIVQHELIHAFDLVALRDAWRAGGSQGAYPKFLTARVKERGAALRRAWRSLPREVFSAYNFGDPGKMNDVALGDEFMRMVVQAVRTGKTDEVVQALFRAQQEAEGNPKGVISDMLKNWVEALKGVYAKMKAVFDPATAPPEFIKDFDGITKALDKYRVLVNEKTNETTKPPKPAGTTVQTQESDVQDRTAGLANPKPDTGSTTLLPQTETKALTIREALDQNAKVEFNGIRGRLAQEADGALVVRNKDNDYLVKDFFEPGQNLADLGVRVLKASPLKDEIRATHTALNEAPPEIAAAEMSRQETPPVPKFVEDAENHPLLNDLADLIEVGQSRQPRARRLVNETPEFKRMLSQISLDQLNRAETIVTNTIDRIEKLGLDPEQERQLTQPFYDLWNGIDTLTQIKNEAKEIRPILQAPQDEAPTAPANPEPTPAPQKARVTKQDRAKAKLADIIARVKAGKANIVDAMRAHIALGEPNAKEFKALYGKGATIKLYNQVLALVNENENKPPARAAQPEGTGQSNLNADVEKNVRDAKMMNPADPAAFLQIMLNMSKEQNRMDAALNFQAAIDYLEAGEKQPAMAARPQFTTRDNRILNEASAQVNRDNHLKFVTDARVKMPEEKSAGGSVLWQGVSPQALRYDSLTETQAAYDAQAAVTKYGGAVQVAERLVNEKQGDFLGFNEDDPHSIIPSAKVFATMANVRDQLIDIQRDSANAGASMDALAHLHELIDIMTARLVASTTTAGQASQLGDSGAQIRDGNSARKTFVDAIMEGVDGLLGKGAREKAQALTQALNENMANSAGLASVAPKVIKYVRDMERTLKGRKFEDGYRKTVVQNLKKLKKIVNKAAARAAQFMANSDDDPTKLTKLAESLVSEFSGLPKDVRTRTEEQVFMGTVARFVRGIGKEMGLVTKEPKGNAESVAVAMSAILKNPEAYQRFANAFVADYVREYGGSEPTQEFRDEANEIYARIMSKSNGRDLIKPLVNEKMRELETKFSQLVRGHYTKGRFEVEAIRDSIAKEMRDQGVTDEAVIDQLAKDVEESMLDSLHEAREKFFGSSPTIREFLRHIGTNLRQATTSLAIHSDKLEGQLKQALIDHFGFPDTADLPIASDMARIMQHELNALVEEQNSREILNWLAQAQKGLDNPNPNRKRNMSKAVETILKMTKVGVMRQEDIYRALAEHFTELPPYRQETVDKIEQLGEDIYNSQHPRQINAIKQEVADLLTEAQPLTTTKARTAAMYYSFLSGPSTILGANPGGNTAQLIAFIAQNILKSLHRPALVYQMLRAIFSTATGKAFWEARETWFNGMELGKQGTKYMTGRSPFELRDPYFKSSITRDTPLKNKLADIDEKFSTGAFKLARMGGGKYVIRALLATDIYFGKIAEELAFTQKMGQRMGTEAMFLSAMDDARAEMESIGQDPDGNRHNRSRLMILTNSIYENARLHDAAGNLVNERAIAWMDSHGEALRVTLNQEPKGLFGALHRAIQNASNAFPILRLFIPFTRIAANSVNMALEFTPVGFARYLAGGEFKRTVGGTATFDDNGQLFRKGGEQERDTDILIRSAMGTLSLMALSSLMGSHSPEDKEEPFFWIYGNGPRDKTMRGLLFERGWKPNTVKVGGTYYNYLLTPLAMGFSILGYHADKYLDGQLPMPNDLGVASSGVALMDAVTNQSFLASISDFMGAVDSPDPEAKLNRLFARTTSVYIPSLVKQIDRFLDPSFQQAETFGDVMRSQIPIVRHGLKPYLNYFGQPVMKSTGAIPFPGMQVLATDQRSDDKVIRFLTDNSIDLPGYSKATRLRNNPMTEEQRYEYVKLAGPRIHARLQADLAELETMDRQQQKDRIRKIAEEEKAQVRNELAVKYFSR